jgi:ubiquinone/menaquinone biosynthesis C-methylase UbiE
MGPVSPKSGRLRGMSDQGAYYTETAGQYEAMHLLPGDEHFVALEYALGLFHTLRVRSVLDVGCGTGRAVRFILERRPDLRVVGLEPVAALRAIGEESGVGEYVAGVGEALPFADGEFDAVMATGVMHHIADPRPAVVEMCRVASRAVMISDTNRYGSGTRFQRAVKMAVYRAGLGRTFERARTGGKGYLMLDGDGQHFPYSVYDQIDLLATFGDRVFMIPTKGTPATGWTGPLARNSHALVVAAREPRADGWAGT